jgi:sulfoxide reductase catalytic subunit YedY
MAEDKVTDESLYLNRRALLRAGVLAGTVAATGWVYRKLNPIPITAAARLLPLDVAITTTQPTTSPSAAGFTTSEALTSFDDITHYNNFYEFSLDKESVAAAASGFVSRPWQVAVGGLCAKPRTFEIDDLLKLAPTEQRIYRMRCVEAWSMVIPWDGFSLSKVLDAVQPLSSAKYVAFQTLMDPERFPNEGGGDLPWPYVEGLRMDEAMHPLTILASGIYGKQMPPQDGAPIRLVIPWKYGFKGIKSIVKITLMADQPPATWNIVAPDEYGFYANVNPNVDHPRWSQAMERRIGVGEQPTLMFNGYGDEVAWMYAGMDLRKNF